MKNRAQEIANDIDNGERFIVLLLDTANSNEPYMSFPIVSEIEDDLIQGKILKRVDIAEYKQWVDSSNHRYNNEIRQLIADIL